MFLYKLISEHEDGRREVARTVLWNSECILKQNAHTFYIKQQIKNTPSIHNVGKHLKKNSFLQLNIFKYLLFYFYFIVYSRKSFE